MYSQYPYRQPSAFTITWALYYDLRPYMPEKARASKLPFFMHRERGLHLDEREFTVDGVPVSATILGVALTCTHAGAEHARRGEGCFFYIPKTESAAEVRIYRDLFDACAVGTTAE